MQAINGENSFSSISGGYTAANLGSSAEAYLANTRSGTAPTWTQGTSPAHGAASALALTEDAGKLPFLDPGAWQAENRTGVDGDSCYNQGNINISGGYLNMLTTLQNTNCESIDCAYATKSYRSSSISTRNLRFTYGTVEFVAKIGGGNSTGAWPVLEMFNACSQLTYPYGTDSNCTNTEEIDITEINGSNFDRINQQIHLSDGGHNDQCTPSVRDASQNFHDYKLTWSAGSLIWQIDGKTTCTIKASYLPGDAMAFFIDMNAGSKAVCAKRQ
jgi:beta-glucanase (GH16 family)